jgi:hypothetical protein
VLVHYASTAWWSADDVQAWMSRGTRIIRVTMTEKWTSPNQDEANLSFFEECLYAHNTLPAMVHALDVRCWFCDGVTKRRGDGEQLMWGWLPRRQWSV